MNPGQINTTSIGPPQRLQGVGGGLFISVVDMTLVFTVLTVIACVMALLSRLVGWSKERKEGDAVAVPGKADGPFPDDIDDETAAAISAAVSTVMKGRRFRIAGLAGYDVQTARWAMAGRQKTILRKG